MQEMWKDICGYEGLYQVSDMGNIKSLYVNRILPKHDTGNGYYIVRLCKKNIHKFILLHRLVAQAFIPNPNNYPIINHKDCNPQNNSVENLEWCTQQYNVTYGGRIQKMLSNKSYQSTMNKLKKKVYQYDLNGTFIKSWNSARDAYTALGVSKRNICSCCLNKRKTAGNYIWRYEKKCV